MSAFLIEIRKIEVRKVRKVDRSIERIENCDASFVEHISNIKDSFLFLKVQKYAFSPMEVGSFTRLIMTLKTFNSQNRPPSTCA